MKPFLKWAGGKSWIVPKINDLHSKNTRLVELFAGSAAVSLGIEAKNVLLNDVNRYVIDCHRWAALGLKRLDMPINWEYDEAVYYANRERFNNARFSGMVVYLGALFYYINRNGYNGLCRFNRRGECNVPFGRYKTVGYIDDFSEYASVMKYWEMQSADFREVQLRDDDFIFADPPYDGDATAFTGYFGKFDWGDQVALATMLSQHGGKVVLTNLATDRICNLYRQLGFTLEFHSVSRSINSDASNRKPVIEVIATKGV